MKIREHIDKNISLENPFICCCTANTEKVFKKKSLEAGMDQFLTKLVSHNELMTEQNN